MVTIQSLRRFVTRHPLAAYFGMAFAFTWILQIPLVLAQNGFGLIPFTLPTNLFTVPAVIAGPTLAAFVVTAATEGRAGVRQLLRRYLHWRVGIQWYLLVLFSYPILLLVATSIVLGQGPLHLLRQLWPLIGSVFLPAFVSIPGHWPALGRSGVAGFRPAAPAARSWSVAWEPRGWRAARTMAPARLLLCGSCAPRGEPGGL